LSGQPPETRPGDKGQWYFEALGIEAQAGPTSLQEVAESGETTRTSDLVTKMWDQTGELPAVSPPDDPMAGWEPSQLSATVTSKRRLRWPVVVLAILVGGLAAFTLWWMPQVSDQRASDHAELMRSSLSGVYGDLANVQAALATATEPESQEPDLGSIAVDLAGIADSAARLLDVANQPVPSPMPLSAREPFDYLDSFRDGLDPLAAEATAIRSDVADVAAYRLAFARVLNVVELPLTADSATINSQTASLAQVLADSVAALATMPLEGPFTAHRALVDAEITAFAQWQNDYLAALREGRTARASQLVDGLNASLDQLHNEVVSPLAMLRSDIDARILELADRLSRAIALVP